MARCYARTTKRGGWQSAEGGYSGSYGESRWPPATWPGRPAAAFALAGPHRQLLQQPARTLAEKAVHARDAGQLDQAEEFLRRAVRAAGDLGYL